ncbi:putative DNA-binding transcriptional regulator AlpA [Bradyrhizobium sp. RT6a]|uniref:helix-turn-helix transcriptional regulator n=1 Tax=Bradyrhizobium sp. RT6a TaxID=3156381 RepID=UPI0033973A5A
MSTTYLKTRQLRERLGCCQTFIEEHIRHDPEFPKPSRLGRLRVWPIAAVEAYEVSIAGKAVQQ